MRIRFEKQADRNLIDARVYIKGGMSGREHGWYESEGKNHQDALQNLCLYLAEMLQDEIKLSNQMYNRLRRINKATRDYEGY